MCISEENTQIFTAEKVIIHEKYMDGDGSNYYDIALLILEDTAEDFTPICLPEAGNCSLLVKWYTNTKVYPSRTNPTK
jgi:hypothetical protein